MKFVDPTKPYRKSGGWATRLFVLLPAVPNTNGGLIENLFPLSRPLALPTRGSPSEKYRLKLDPSLKRDHPR
jgi:hypothetical protein